MKRYIICSIVLIFGCILVQSCRKDQMIIPAEYNEVDQMRRPNDAFYGLYLLNEGNMGSNKASIDYLDFMRGMYIKNIYSERNPNVALELGDVGNDIAIYGSKMYVVVNSSHKVEILDAMTAKRIAKVDITNCRYVTFDKGYAYISSYVGPIQQDPKAPRGAIFKLDTASLKVVDNIEVGYQPEELAVKNGWLYVANSGGYRAPNYDNTVSVINLETFKKIRDVPVGINLHRLRKDYLGNLWISSRGNYNDIPSNLYKVKINSQDPTKFNIDTLNIACSNLALSHDKAYVIGTEWSDREGKNIIRYALVDVPTGTKIANNFITDGTEDKIKLPYGIIVHPVTGEIFITDAKNYVSSGNLICYTKEGRKRWSVKTGDIPSAMCFLPKKK